MNVPPPRFPHVFLMSPARTNGIRGMLLQREQAEFDLAIRLREGRTTIGEVYAFISGLYFRGKLTYAHAFAAPPEGVPHAVVIVPGIGLVPPDAGLNAGQLRQIAGVPIEEDNHAYSAPLLRDAVLLNQHAGTDCRYVLLGSIATEKYTQPLLTVFGDRLLFPAEFIGRGDMSRGGLMLRCARSGQELTYVGIQGAARRGPRPPKLEPWRKRSS